MKTMDNSNKVSQQELEEVSGGNTSEMKELREFIRKHDPDFKIWNNIDVSNWLSQRSGISFRSISSGDYWLNEYELSDGRDISHAELMKMLRERFPD